MAVYSEADRDSLHTMLADEAICIGPAASTDSYLNIERILAATVAMKADAIHPGFGFLSENARFAKLCAECNIAFIGPSAEIINKMGNKSEARKTMMEAGVPVVPGKMCIRDRERDAFKICQEKIKKHHLDMKLIDAEYTFDNNKVLFYFTADGRIDFRELVKDLASVFKTRIELRQVGVRDETKIMGGIGICGRALCCHSYLSEFIPVSIKMAKEQNLSLNPTKISGVCGRLMCCLKNEEETYEVLNSKLPNPGDYVTTSDGLKGEVHSVNVLRLSLIHIFGSA